MATAGPPPLRVPGPEASNALSLDPGNDCPQRHNNKVAGSGRLEAAFDPTGARASVNKDLDSTVKGRAVFQQEGSGRFSNFKTL